jgi:hypothetical protein
MQTYGKIFYLHAYPSKKERARVANLTPYAKEREAQPMLCLLSQRKRMRI